jgi:hypothetical protein
MYPIKMRSATRLTLAKWSLGEPWTPVGSRAPRVASRHLRWAAGITSRLALRSYWPGLHPEVMTMTHPVRARILRLQTLLRHTHSQTRLMYSPAMESTATGAARPNSHIETNRQFAIPHQTIVERKHSPVSFVREIVRHGAPLAQSVGAIQRNRTVEFVEKIAPPRISRLVPGNIGSVLPRPHRPIAQSRSEQDKWESVSESLPERVVRKHRRIEARVFLQPRGLAPQIFAAPTPEEPAVSHTTLARRRAQPRLEEPTESPRRPHSAPQASNINVAQITDAVLQQLDRRLIGARERMGRI